MNYASFAAFCLDEEGNGGTVAPKGEIQLVRERDYVYDHGKNLLRTTALYSALRAALRIALCTTLHTALHTTLHTALSTAFDKTCTVHEYTRSTSAYTLNCTLFYSNYNFLKKKTWFLNNKNSRRLDNISDNTILCVQGRE